MISVFGCLHQTQVLDQSEHALYACYFINLFTVAEINRVGHSNSGVQTNHQYPM